MANQNPFGQSITAEDILEALTFFDDWEARYKYIIDLGKELPALAESKKDDGHIVRGCQSQVWIDSQFDDGKVWLEADSDAFIVKGLLGVVLSVFNGKSPQTILDYDIEGFFEQLGLLNHLSQTRGNGLRAMVQKIRALASEYQSSS